MDYRNLTVNTWGALDTLGNVNSGYKATWLAPGERQSSSLHIFKDENGFFHFAIEVDEFDTRKIDDPSLNGLQISISRYRLSNDKLSQVISLRCNLTGFLGEFTEVTKEIARNILDDGGDPYEVVKRVTNNWRAFWGNKNKRILTEDEQVGLICELEILGRLSRINPTNAINAWLGPLGEKHDFTFADWNFEIKGTQRQSRLHTINGIDQLKPATKKKLGFISFLVTYSNSQNAKSLPQVVDQLTTSVFAKHPSLVVRFHELLASAGYDLRDVDAYKQTKIDILNAVFYKVDERFPCLTSDCLTVPLNERISGVMYDLSLEGLSGDQIENLNWGDYFY